MNRREFFKGIGATIVVLPLLKVLPIVQKEPIANIKEVKTIGRPYGFIYGVPVYITENTEARGLLEIGG